MFQFPGFAPASRVARSPVLGCPIRKSPDQWLFAPPRSLSQLITSFFASESQGIPRTLLVTFSNFSRYDSEAQSLDCSSFLATHRCSTRGSLLSSLIRQSVKELFALTEQEWRITDSNRGPPACKAGALPAELNPQSSPGQT